MSADGLVYVCASDHNVYALDGAKGVLKWFFATDAQGVLMCCSPAIGADDTLYVCPLYGVLYAQNCGGQRLSTISGWLASLVLYEEDSDPATSPLVLQDFLSNLAAVPLHVEVVD